jgi:hypothetical protein
MNDSPTNSGHSHPPFTTIKIEGFEVSCVALNPFEPGFSFGSDDGKVVFTNEAGTPLREMNGSPSGEAINGVASFGNSIAVSSRQEVTLRTWTPDDPRRLSVSLVPYGAHGICASPGGYYLAPLGTTGIMMMRADADPGDPVGVMTTDKENMYFYRVLARGGRDGKELLICAARHGGIGITEVRWGESNYNMRTATFPELDAVDVCFVGEGSGSSAMAAVSRDGLLILTHDMLRDEKPVTMRLQNIKGRAYRLLSARGHLFLLTSSALYGLMNLGKRLLEGPPLGKFIIPKLVIQMDAVDASLIDDRWLMIVMPDDVRRYDLDLIHASIPEDMYDGEVRPFTLESAEAETVEQRWEVDTITTGVRELVGA